MPKKQEGDEGYWKDKWSEAQETIRVLRELMFMRIDRLKVNKLKKKRKKNK